MPVPALPICFERSFRGLTPSGAWTLLLISLLSAPPARAQARAPSRQLEINLRIGSRGGDEEYLFYAIQGVSALSDGRIVVLDRSFRALRLFTPSGKFSKTVATSGQGPGEVGGGGSLLVAERDTIFVADYDNLRINVYSAEGEFARSFPVSGFFGSESSLALAGEYLVFRRPSPYGSADALVWLDRTGRAVGESPLVYGHPDLGSPSTPQAPLLARHPVWAGMRDARVVVGYSDGNSFTELGPAGDTLSVWTIDDAPSRVLTPGDQRRLAALWRQRLPLGGIPRSMWNRIVPTFPDRWPLISGIFVGPEGHLWIQAAPTIDGLTPEHFHPGSGAFRLGAPRWLVVARESLDAVAEVRATEPIRLDAARGDELYGVAFGALGVPRVIRARLR